MSEEIVTPETPVENTEETQNTETPVQEETPAPSETPVETPVQETPTETPEQEHEIINQVIDGTTPGQTIIRYVKVGQETRLRLRTLSSVERNTLAMDAATLSLQIETKKLERNSLVSQFNVQIQNIDNEIETLRNTSLEKSNRASVGEITEPVLCDVYETANETIFVPEGADVTQSANIIARRVRESGGEGIQ